MLPEHQRRARPWHWLLVLCWLGLVSCALLAFEAQWITRDANGALCLAPAAPSAANRTAQEN